MRRSPSIESRSSIVISVSKEVRELELDFVLEVDDFLLESELQVEPVEVERA